MIRTKKNIETYEVTGVEKLVNGWERKIIKFGHLNREVKLNEVDNIYICLMIGNPYSKNGLWRKCQAIKTN